MEPHIANGVIVLLSIAMILAIVFIEKQGNRMDRLKEKANYLENEIGRNKATIKQWQEYINSGAFKRDQIWTSIQPCKKEN